jgi:hypothetical protein
MSISGKGAQSIAVRDGVSVLRLGVTRNGDFKKSLVNAVRFRYALQ